MTVFGDIAQASDIARETEAAWNNLNDDIEL